MTTPPNATAESALVTAAASLEAELLRYEEHVAAARRLEITSEKELLESKAVLEACAGAEQRMRERLGAFAEAMQAMQSRQHACVEETVATARRIEARIHDRAALLERFAALGARARAVDEPVQAVMQGKAAGAADAELLGALSEVIARTDGVLEDAAAIGRDAHDRGWEDIAREARSLEEQLQSARARVLEAQRDMAGRSPS